MESNLETLINMLGFSLEPCEYSCEYEIMPNDDGYSLYRKLFPGEEIYYIRESHRLRKAKKAIWLHLQYDEKMDILEIELQRLKGLRKVEECEKVL